MKFAKSSWLKDSIDKTNTLVLVSENYIDWDKVSKTEGLSEIFIEKNKEKVNWFYICIYQKLSEDFMRRNSEYLDWWWAISKFQTLSNSFKEEFKHKLNFK